jgi:hypothetical protein
VVRATWAPKGQTPVLAHKFNSKRMSMSAALCYRPDRSAAELVFATQSGAYNTETLINFLNQLHTLLGADAKITLLWDGLRSHRSRQMTQFIGGHRAWLRVERLPAYAPELNPAEGLWGPVCHIRPTGRHRLPIACRQDIEERPRTGACIIPASEGRTPPRAIADRHRRAAERHYS